MTDIEGPHVTIEWELLITETHRVVVPLSSLPESVRRILTKEAKFAIEDDLDAFDAITDITYTYDDSLVDERVDERIINPLTLEKTS